MLDDMILAEAELARDRMETAQDEVETARAAYHRAIRRLHAAGATLREIADALGLSHQRVHQVVDSGSMIDPETSPGDLVRCSFCNTDQKNTKKLVAGPGVYICDWCVLAASAAASGRPPKKARGITVPIPMDGKAQCSFCGKKRAKVTWMVAGPGAATRICSECVRLCEQILAEEGVD